MERTEQEHARAFAAWLRQELSARGYNLSVRGGGQRAFAALTGLSPTTLSRMLSGTVRVDVRTLELVAEGLDVPLTTVLIAAGVLTDDDLRAAIAHQTPAQPLTPEDAAAELGITDPHARHVFIATINALRTPPDPPQTAES